MPTDGPQGVDHARFVAGALADENRSMKHWHRRLLQVGLAAAVVLCLAWFAAQSWLGSADFRVRVESAASAQAGVPVRLGRVALDVWPVPGVALEKVRIETQPAITVERVEARAQLWRDG